MNQIALRLHEIGLQLEGMGLDEVVMALGVAEREVLRLEAENSALADRVRASLKREAEMHGVHVEPIDDLLKRLPRVRREVYEDIKDLSLCTLQRRFLIQADWLRSYFECLDDLGFQVGLDGHRSPRDIRAIVEELMRDVEAVSDIAARAILR